MITAFVQIKMPEAVTLEKATEIFSSTAPNYQTIDGLVRKYYLLSEDGQMAGGVYLWESRDKAEKLYTDDWRQMVTDKYGMPPSVTYFHSPVIVDNLVGAIQTEE